MKAVATGIVGGFVVKRLNVQAHFGRAYEASDRTKRYYAKTMGVRPPTATLVKLVHRGKVRIRTKARGTYDLTVESFARNYVLEPIRSTPAEPPRPVKDTVSTELQCLRAILRELRTLVALWQPAPKSNGAAPSPDPRQLRLTE